MDLPQLLFSFSGRINRQPYWLVGLGMGVASGLITTVAAAVLSETLVTVGMIGVSIATVWIGLALSVKRAHDRGRSALFILLFLVPLLNIWPLIELYFLRGTSGENQYGADPLGG